MEHIPTPRSPKYLPPEVLCFVRSDFSCSGSPHFDSYPESRGWQQKLFVAGDFRQNHTEGECREFLQEWLYFKVMAAVFGSAGIEIDMDDFTRRDGSQLLIDSTNLIRYISEFERQFRDLGTQAQIVSVQAIDRVLTVTQRLIIRECSMTSPLNVRSENWPFDPITSLSFMILGCTLAFAASRIVQVLPDKTHALEIYKKLRFSHDQWGISALLYERMRSDNWCPHSLARFASKGSSVIGMYYASLLDIPGDGKDHKECNVRECLHMTVDEKTYKTQHKTQDASHLPHCPLTVLDRAAIIRSLRSKSVPLLRIREADSTKVEIEVVPYNENIKYVAISHVWAHGLGNVEGNWLHGCQIRRLASLVAALYSFSCTETDVYFWIETICVPRRNEKDDADYRRTAIDLINDTYQNADKVLVLDDQIARSTSRATPEESLLRILSSGWMTRLWTLQEGLLAGKLRFQFRERALDAEDMLSDIMPIHHSSVWMEAYEFFSSLRTLKILPPRKKLRYLWNYLQWRSTSHSSDETICLSVLVGQQPSKGIGLPHTERMKIFLGKMDGIPSDIVFMPGPRLSEDGWRWAPTSFMARHQWTAYEHFQETIIPGAPDHIITEQTNISQRFTEGLQVHFPGITLSEVPHNLDMVFRVEETHLRTKMRFHVVCLYDRCPPEWKDIDIKSLKHPTIILQAYPEAYGAIHAIFVDAYKGPGLAGEVVLDRTAQRVTPVRFICRATVSLLDTVTSQASEEIESYYRGDEQVSRSCKGRLLDQQWWYVG